MERKAQLNSYSSPIIGLSCFNLCLAVGKAKWLSFRLPRVAQVYVGFVAPRISGNPFIFPTIILLHWGCEKGEHKTG